jgi:hypothetical protein
LPYSVGAQRCTADKFGPKTELVIEVHRQHYDRSAMTYTLHVTDVIASRRTEREAMRSTIREKYSFFKIQSRQNVLGCSLDSNDSDI